MLWNWRKMVWNTVSHRHKCLSSRSRRHVQSCEKWGKAAQPRSVLSRQWGKAEWFPNWLAKISLLWKFSGKHANLSQDDRRNFGSCRKSSALIRKIGKSSSFWIASGFKLSHPQAHRWSVHLCGVFSVQSKVSILRILQAVLSPSIRKTRAPWEARNSFPARRGCSDFMGTEVIPCVCCQAWIIDHLWTNQRFLHRHEISFWLPGTSHSNAHKTGKNRMWTEESTRHATASFLLCRDRRRPLRAKLQILRYDNARLPANLSCNPACKVNQKPQTLSFRQKKSCKSFTNARETSAAFSKQSFRVKLWKGKLRWTKKSSNRHKHGAAFVLKMKWMFFCPFAQFFSLPRVKSFLVSADLVWDASDEEYLIKPLILIRWPLTDSRGLCRG